MLLNPAVLALVVASIALAGMSLTASLASIGSLAGWRSDDCGEDQLAREHRLLLVEMTSGVVFALQIVSVFAFVWVVNRLHSLLPGAMCAAGSLAANRFGYPALNVKLVAILIVALWWVVHRESRAAMHPGLVRAKHWTLLVVTLVLVADSTLQIRYFAALRPDVLTSCCATIFRETAAGLGAHLAAVSPRSSQVALLTLLAATTLAGGRLLSRGSRPWIFSVLAGATAAAGLVAIVSWIAPAYYEAPTHHCPFCLLEDGVGYVGYLLYPALFGGLLAGLGVGVVHGLRRLDPLHSLRPHAEYRLCRASLACFLAFALIALWPLATSNLRLGEL